MKEKGEATSEALFEYIKEGGSIDVYDDENPTEILGTLTSKSFTEANQLMMADCKEDFKAAKSDNWDANTADIWFQLATMKEIVFG